MTDSARVGYVEFQSTAFIVVEGVALVANQRHFFDYQHPEIQEMVNYGLLVPVDDETRAALPSSAEVVASSSGCGCGK